MNDGKSYVYISSGRLLNDLLVIIKLFVTEVLRIISFVISLYLFIKGTRFSGT